MDSVLFLFLIISGIAVIAVIIALVRFFSQLSARGRETRAKYTRDKNVETHINSLLSDFEEKLRRADPDEQMNDNQGGGRSR